VAFIESEVERDLSTRPPADPASAAKGLPAWLVHRLLGLLLDRFIRSR
jgi:hypothetical protein